MKAGMSQVEYAEYKARVARRRADPGYAARVAARKAVAAEPDSVSAPVLPEVTVPIVLEEVAPVAVEAFLPVEVPEDLSKEAPKVEDSYTGLSKRELLALAAERGIEVSDKLSKAKIIEALLG